MKNKPLQYVDYLIIFGLMFMIFSSTISIAGSSIGFGLAFLGWIIKILIIREINFNNPFNLPIIIFICGILVSFMDTYNLSKSLWGLEDYLLPILLYYLIVNNINDLNLIKRFLNLGFISIFVSSSYALFWQHYHLGVGRIYSTLMALDFGALLMVYLLFTCTYLLFFEEGSIKKVRYFILVPILLLTFLYNKTRGAWLGFIGAEFIIFWFKGRKWIPIFITIIILIAILSPLSIQKRIKSIIDLEHNRSNLGRIALWKGAILMFKDHPINGVGLGNFSQVYAGNYMQPHTDSTAHAHNNFLHLLAETGLVGLFSFFYLIYFIISYLYRGYCRVDNKFYKLFILTSLSIFIGVFIIQGLTEANFYRSVVNRTVWFMIAMSVVVIKNISNEEETI